MTVFLNVIPRVWNLLLYEELFILLPIEYESEQKRLFFYQTGSVIPIYKLELFIWVLSSYELNFYWHDMMKKTLSILLWVTKVIRNWAVCIHYKVLSLFFFLPFWFYYLFLYPFFILKQRAKIFRLNYLFYHLGKRMRKWLAMCSSNLIH